MNKGDLGKVGMRKTVPNLQDLEMQKERGVTALRKRGERVGWGW